MVPLNQLIAPVQGRAGAAELPVYSVTKRAGFVPSAQYFKKQVFSSDLSTYKVVDKGQFAYATIHLDEGSIGIAPTRCVISPMYTVFSTDESRVSAEYLIRFLKSPRALASYPRLGRGTAERRKSISLDALGRLEVPLPPLPEQRRIAAILDEADALRSRARAQLKSYDEVEDLAFVELVGCHLRDSHVALGDLVEEFRYGTSAKSGSSGFPVLRIPNVTGRGLDLDGLKTVHLPDAEIDRLRLNERDVLFVRSNGNPDVVGRCSAFASLSKQVRQGADWVFASYLIRARLRPGIEPEAIAALARSKFARGHLRRGAATSAGQYNINTTVLRSMPAFDPSNPGQFEFAQVAKSIASQRNRALRRMASLDALFASLQHRAFRGEL
ncbi:restriction endonuclease subunit S [Microbacterium sp. NPDC078428]|uniref:restriction endonuclease subunit S n=1 Tax=Microbacterium sp. NPDC078428 TaxID=3364190 RepID=UPI0037C7F4F0